MSKKVESDLVKINKDRRKAEEEYLANKDAKLEIQRIQAEGIADWDELVNYIVSVIEGVKHSEDLARLGNNSIVYSEAIGIRREFTKILGLMALAGEGDTEEADPENAGEAAHRKNNDGGEAYV